MTGDETKPDSRTCIPCSFHIGSMNATRIIFWLIAITLVSFAIGCGILIFTEGFPASPDNGVTLFRPNPLLTPNTTVIPLDGATKGDVRITLGAGELSLQGGAPATALMESTVFSKAAVWQPELVQGINGSVKSVTMTEKGHKGKEWFAVDSPNDWAISLNDKVPLRLSVNVGAGDNLLDLGMLNLETLDVQTAAGDTIIDLAGYHGERYDAMINCGVGDLILRVPRDSNTLIRVHNALGDIDNRGFVQDDDQFVTAVFNSSHAVNEITLNQGIGSLTLEAI
jgi:hypothetical protein